MGQAPRQNIQLAPLITIQQTIACKTQLSQEQGDEERGSPAGDGGQGVPRVRGGLRSELRGHLAVARWLMRCSPLYSGDTEAQLQRGLWAWAQCCFWPGPISHKACWSPRGYQVFWSGHGSHRLGRAPGFRTPCRWLWLLLYLISLDEAALVLVQGLEGLEDDAVQLP